MNVKLKKRTMTAVAIACLTAFAVNAQAAPRAVTIPKNAKSTVATAAAKIIKNNLKKIFVVGVALFLMCGSVFYQYTTFSRNNVIISSSKTKVSTVANTNGNIIVELNNEKMHSLDSEDGYYLSYHILTSQGDYYSYDGLRTPIKVSPKSKREVELQYLAPSVEGNYILQVDIVKENVAWLSTEGNQTLDIEMQVVK